MRTREEHLKWCKEQAKVYIDEGDVMNAVTSILSDLNKHPETKLAPYHVLVQLGMKICMDNDLQEAKRFIEGFN